MARRTQKRTTRSQTRLMAEAQTVRGGSAGSDRQTSPRSGWVASVFLLLLSCVLLGVFLLDDRFQVRSVAVKGATLVDEQEIIAAAGLAGKPIFLLNGRAVASALSAGFGCFERVRVQTRLPDRVTIQVTEKSAMLLWERQGSYWWLDNEGRVLSLAGGHGELPIVHDRSGLDVSIGSRIAGVPWDYVRQTIAALPAVSDFEYTLEDGLIIFVTTDRWPVYLGSDGNPAYKVAVLRELTAALATEGAEVVYIDLKNERRPAIKMGSG